MEGWSQPPNHSLAGTFAPHLSKHLNSCRFLPSTTSAHSFSYFCLSFFNSLFCLPSSVSKYTINILPPPLPILAYTLLPCQSKYLFSQNSCPTIFPSVCAPPSPAGSSSSVGLPCLLTHASCHFPCSLSLPVCVSPLPHLISLLLPPVLLQVPQLPADARCSTQRTCHSEPGAPKNSIQASLPYIFLSPCLECINGSPASDCVCVV